MSEADGRWITGQDFIHNHPGGRSLSDADVYMAVSYDWAGIHAVARDGGRGTRGGLIRLYTMRVSPLKPETGDTAERRLMRVRNVYRRMEANVMRDFAALIRSGQMDPGAAEAAHAHQVWIRVAAELPDDLTYSWDILPPK